MYLQNPPNHTCIVYIYIDAYTCMLTCLPPPYIGGVQPTRGGCIAHTNSAPWLIEMWICSFAPSNTPNALPQGKHSYSDISAACKLAPPGHWHKQWCKDSSCPQFCVPTTLRFFRIYHPYIPPERVIFRALRRHATCIHDEHQPLRERE